MKILILAMLLVAIQAAPPSMRKDVNANTTAPANIKGQGQDNKATTLPMPIQSKNQEDAKRSDRNSQGQSQATTQHPIWAFVFVVKALASALSLIFTGLLVFVGFITCGVIAWQSWETRRAAEAVRNSERAWILVEKISPNNKEIKGDTIPVFGYRFKVFGKTPAKIVEVAFRYRIVQSRQRGNLKEPDLPIPPEYGKSPEIDTIPDIGSVLPPLREFDVAVILESANLSWTEYGLITSREKFICSYGFVKYIDAFDRTKIRETRFCYVYDAKLGGILKSEVTGEELSPDDFRVGGPPEYNDAT